MEKRQNIYKMHRNVSFSLVLLLILGGCVELGVDTDKDFYALNKKTVVEVTSTISGYSLEPYYSFMNYGVVEVVIYKLPEWEVVGTVHGPESIKVKTERDLEIVSEWDASGQEEGLYMAAIRWTPSDMFSEGDIGPFTCVDLFTLGPSSYPGKAKRAFKAIELSERKSAEAQAAYKLLMYAAMAEKVSYDAPVDLSEFGLGVHDVGAVLDTLSPYTGGQLYDQKTDMVAAEEQFIAGDYDSAFKNSKATKESLVLAKQIIMTALEQNGLGKGDLKDISF
jgi:hypothetical protein